MSDAYNKLMVEVGNMSKRQTTAVFDYIDELRAEVKFQKDLLSAYHKQNCSAPETRAFDPSLCATAKWVVRSGELTCSNCGKGASEIFKHSAPETDCNHGQIVQNGCPHCERKIGHELTDDFTNDRGVAK